eukprot:Hpha_TRINITY_DN16629_c2_g1::TRINITY_DN16629_c2_g1_i1::g.182981::m.182981
MSDVPPSHDGSIPCSSTALLKKASVVGTAAQVDEYGNEHAVYIARAEWKVVCDGKEQPVEVSTDVERRYNEFYKLYYAMVHHSVAYDTDFPRRLLWGSMYDAVVEDRQERLDAWLRAVSGDAEASTDPVLVEWLNAAAALAKASETGEGAPEPAEPKAEPKTEPDEAPKAEVPPAAATPTPTPPVPAAPAHTLAPKAASPDSPVDTRAELVRRLVGEGFDEDELWPLLDVTTEEALLRDLYATHKGAALPSLEASIVARECWLDKHKKKLNELSDRGYAQRERMAGLLEAFAGNVNEACSAYGPPDGSAYGPPPGAGPAPAPPAPAPAPAPAPPVAPTGQPHQQLVERLVAEGYDAEEITKLVAITTDEALLREMAQKRSAPAPAPAPAPGRAPASLLDQLASKGFTNRDRMAALLEAFEGDVDSACAHYH